MSRVLPLAVLMTMYSELAAAYVFGLDAVVLFFMMVHTSLRQRCTLGNEKCSCGNLCYFYTTRLPALLFFYNDSYMGRSYDNSIMHPLLYLCARGISLGAITYYWWYAQVRPFFFVWCVVCGVWCVVFWCVVCGVWCFGVLVCWCVGVWCFGVWCFGFVVLVFGVWCFDVWCFGCIV